MANNILEFTGEYRFLSNFWPIQGHRTVEHYYQACKTFDLDERRKILQAETPGQAKRLGQKVTLREDWDDIRLDTMRCLTIFKYAADEELGDKLLATGDALLYEGNTWGDFFWGVDLERLQAGEVYGENHLGVILMKVRSDLPTMTDHAILDTAIKFSTLTGANLV